MLTSPPEHGLRALGYCAGCLGITMNYTLHRLAAGSYDLALDGAIIGSVVREVASDGTERGWRAELLDDAPASERPSPFSEVEYPFRSLEAVTAWLGGAAILGEADNR